ncbi:LCP family protein [Phytohabitans sp. LJ34]|uniref:LCP family protein n=1 Tax=Phytohabitans sp. LJ34 TaxID=3452217 RepID=UPI003F8BE2E5
MADTSPPVPSQEASPERPLDVLEQTPDKAPAPSRKRRWWRLIALVLGLSLVLGAAGSGGALWLYARSVEGDIERVDAFAGVPEGARPPVVAEKAHNYLVVGSDSRAPDSTDGSRTDAILLFHVAADRKSAQMISIPRDTWVQVPKSADGRHGGTEAKINASFAWGGVPLLVRTVEGFTGVRMDSVVLIDFAGFERIVDTLGGVDLTVDKDFTSIHPPHRKFATGDQHMDGATALDYARQRYQFKDGDFTRIRHQQQLVRAVVAKATQRGLMRDPGRLNGFLRATAKAVSVDKDLDLFGTAWSMRDLREEAITSITSPSSSTGMIGGQSVVLSDEQAAAGLYKAVREDDMDTWLMENPQD